MSLKKEDITKLVCAILEYFKHDIEVNGDYSILRVYQIDVDNDKILISIRNCLSTLDNEQKEILYKRLCDKQSFVELGKLYNTSHSNASNKFKKIITIILRQLRFYDAELKKDPLSSLTSRTSIILHRYGINNFDDLKNLDFNKFISLRGVGRKTWLELKEFMDKNNIPYKINEFYIDKEKYHLTKYVNSVINNYIIDNNKKKKCKEEVSEYIDKIIDSISKLVEDN